MSVIGIQRRMMLLGRVRLGEKGPKGEPKRLGSFRFTSASNALIAAVAAKYGGKPREWKTAPNEGYYEVTTDATELDIILPPTFSEADGTPSVPWSQYYELWSAGGAQRRCDGVTESLSGDPCLCNPDNRQCQLTTRIQFMLPDLPGLGVWRLDSSGYNAAAELPATLQVLAQAAQEMKFIPAVLRLENRVKKVEGQTRRYVVPVIDLPNVTVGQLVSGTAPSALNAPRPAPPRPELPAAPASPSDPSFEGEPALGPAPPLPGGLESESDTKPTVSPLPDGGVDGRTSAPSDSDSGPLSKDQFDRLMAADFIAPPMIAAVGKLLFPGRSVAKLTGVERRELYDALLREMESVRS